MGRGGRRQIFDGTGLEDPRTASTRYFYVPCSRPNSDGAHPLRWFLCVQALRCTRQTFLGGSLGGFTRHRVPTLRASMEPDFTPRTLHNFGGADGRWPPMAVVMLSGVYAVMATTRYGGTSG
jgi:hypothetical protein